MKGHRPPFDWSLFWLWAYPVGLAIGVSLLILVASLAHAGTARWTRVTALNGHTAQIDLDSITHYAAGRAAVIYIGDGDDFNPIMMRRMYFDCHGHMTDITGGAGVPTTIFVPFESVGGYLADLACGNGAY